ncbi:hypothetical protein M3Y97_00592500 [Aphelenchoides bicaudatus]|nr:hypothetical protein M3Y97_00592500 [Aphelenchoides bicaudatus]
MLPIHSTANTALIITLILLTQVTSIKAPMVYGTLAGKRVCYNCHKEGQCMTSHCVGDFCVKSLVGDRYVSKGCENNTLNSYHRPVSTIEGVQHNGEDAKLGCSETLVFGVPNTICYCNDRDWCNFSTRVVNSHSILWSSLTYLLFKVL